VRPSCVCTFVKVKSCFSHAWICSCWAAIVSHAWLLPAGPTRPYPSNRRQQLIGQLTRIAATVQPTCTRPVHIAAHRLAANEAAGQPETLYNEISMSDSLWRRIRKGVPANMSVIEVRDIPRQWLVRLREVARLSVSQIARRYPRHPYRGRGRMLRAFGARSCFNDHVVACGHRASR
jgi:hypothetical protein